MKKFSKKKFHKKNPAERKIKKIVTFLRANQRKVKKL